MQDQMVSSGAVARDLGIHIQTLTAWQVRVDLDFPRPIVINGRRYWQRSEVEAWKQSRPSISTRKVA